MESADYDNIPTTSVASTSAIIRTPDNSEATDNAVQVPLAPNLNEHEEADDVSDARQVNNFEDLDFLLALQMSLEGPLIDGEDFTSFDYGDFGSRDLTFLTNDSGLHPTPPTGNDLPPSYEDHDQALSRAIAASLTPDTAKPWRTPEPRDRYDVANVETCRTDPRRNGGYYSRFEGSEIPWFPHRYIRDSHSKERSPTCPVRDGRRSLPISNTSVGSPLLFMLGVDELACVMDQLYFPDAFAFAMTCRTVQIAVDLKLKKRMYGKALSVHNGKFCDVCLYSLPQSYFPQHAGSASELPKNEQVTSSACTDCLEFRARVMAHDEVSKVGDDEGEGKGCKWDRHQLVAPVWRPSSRIVVPDSGGFLWYRQRD